MAQGNVYSMFANGNVTICSFVKYDSGTPAPYRVVLCAANTDYPIGVSQENGYLPPIPQATTPQYAAIAGVELKVYGQGSKDILLAIGSGGCTVGDKLTSDASGNGVTASAAQIVGAIAQDTRSQSELCRVIVTSPFPLT